MRSVVALAAVLLSQIFGSAYVPPVTTFYVATTGNDSTGTGSATAPWASVDHARSYTVTGAPRIIKGRST